MSKEQQFQAFPYIFTSHGLVARAANDRLPDKTYMITTNCEVRQENAMSVRFGRIPLTVNGDNNDPLAGGVNTLGRLKSLSQVYRYASAGGNLYRIAGNSPGVWTQIATGLSTQRGSMVTYTPPFSSYPYEYIADANMMLQDNGTGSPSRWGILWPQQPLIAQPPGFLEQFLSFADSTSYTQTLTNIASVTTETPVSETSVPGGTFGDSLFYFTPTSMTGIEQGGNIWIGISGGAGNAYVIQYIDSNGNCWCSVYPPATPYPVASGLFFNILRRSLEVVTNASGTSDYTYVPSIPPWNLQPYSNSSIQQILLHINVHNPADLTSIKLILSSGDATFTNGYTYTIPLANLGTNMESTVTIPFTSLTAIGTPNPASIQAFRIETVQTAAVTYDLYSIAVDLGQGPSILGGVDYSYLYTYWDANTGDESGPSPLMLVGGLYPPTGVYSIPILLVWQASSDSRVTHVNIYRAGGTLAGQYYRIAQVPVGTTAMYDAMPDSIAQTGVLLNIDNYPPITSTLPVPVNTTLAANAAHFLAATTNIQVASLANISLNQRIQIGTGATQETITVIGIGSNYIVAYLQFNHYLGETVYAEAAWAQPARGAQVAFDRLFAYGDKNRPGRLYYSNVGAPSQFGVENYIDMDDPSDPIMGMTPEAFGRAYCFTLGGSVYQIVSVNGSIPVQTKTNATHGMFAFNAYALMDQGVPYYSNDGLYLFNGGTSQEASQSIQWVFRSYAEDTANTIPVMDLTQRSAVCMGFYYDEVYVGYPAVNSGGMMRVIYSARDNRWRNDDIAPTYMLYEKDTATLIYGDASGMVFQDRIGDTDYISPTETQPISFQILTAQLDQGTPHNQKWYTELTVDINTNGQDVNVFLYLYQPAGGLLQVGPFTVSTDTRQQVQFAINGGLGVSGLNVSFSIAGQVTENVDIFEVHLKALVDAELRKTSDTFWTRWGSEQWKVAKQAYIEYTATATVLFGVYQEGNDDAPAFTFTLPATGGVEGGVRTVTWVRFPATKAKNWRIVGMCTDDFQVYETSFVEVKVLGVPKGYSPQPLVM